MNHNNDDQKFLKGKENFFLRAYFYLSNGLTILNEFRNLFLALFALYFTIKIENIMVIAIIFFASIIVLTLVGYYQVHRAQKVREWLNLKFSTWYGMRAFNYTKGTYDILREIRQEMRANRPGAVKCERCQGLGFTIKMEKIEGENIIPGGHTEYEEEICAECEGIGYK